MAYRDDIIALGPSYVYPLDGASGTDIVGAQTATLVSIGSGAALTEDVTNSALTNAVGDSVDIPASLPDLNDADDRFAVAGWFATDRVNPPPKTIYSDGGTTSSFKFVMAFGNNLMLECANTGFIVQLYGPALQPGRPYHLCGVFESNTFGDQVRLYVDGVEYTEAEPAGAAPGGALGTGRGQAALGSPVTSPEVGDLPITLNAPLEGRYNFWAFWGDNADAQLTETEIREELFEKGALPGVTISTDTEANMQIALDAIASTARPDEPLNIRVEPVSGGGNLTLTADAITHDALASIHVQYTGTDTLTWRNSNGSNASIGSTPNGGTIVFVQPQTLTVTVQDLVDSSAIEGARVYLTAGAGGPLSEGTVLMNEVTNASGVATVAFDYTGDQPFTGRVRKGSSAPYYKTGPVAGILGSTALDTTVLLIGD